MDLSDPPAIRPYGDHLDDGVVQLAFTLPTSSPAEAVGAGRALVEQMGLKSVDVVHVQPIGQSCVYLIVYATCPFGVAVEGLADKEETRHTDRDSVEELFRAEGLAELVVVGASTGSDTHSVGLDSIMNLKGFDGDSGLEAYSCFDVHNLGSQVPNEDLVAHAIEVNADVVLVSQTVTQQDLHLHSLTRLADLMDASGLRPGTLLVCGGPRIGPELAKELGYDASFGKGTRPSDVAEYLVTESARRRRSAAGDKARPEPVRG